MVTGLLPGVVVAQVGPGVDAPEICGDRQGGRSAIGSAIVMKSAIRGLLPKSVTRFYCLIGYCVYISPCA